MIQRFRRNRPDSVSHYRKLRFEPLEHKRLLAVDIIWSNELISDGSALDPDFGGKYGADEQVARSIVNRAITDWEAVIDSFNDASNPTDTFDLTVLAVGPGDSDAIAGRGATNPSFANGNPVSASIRMDDNGGGTGWFFDTTPLDDVEFTGIADSFQASFVDATTAGQAHQNDFYRTITHEIGHALGIGLADAIFGLNSGQAVPPTITVGSTVVGPNPRYDILGLSSLTRYTTAPNTIDDKLGQLVFAGTDQVDQLGFLQNRVINGNPAEDIAFNNELWRYDFRNTPGMSVTFTESGGGHFYEGPINANTPGATAHPNELMNAGRTVPAGSDPADTVRQFISDLDASFLADAYGYTVTLPSDLPDFTNPNPDPGEDPTLFSSGTAHILYDANNSTLLVQGLANDPGNPNIRVDDTIDITQVGANIRVNLTYTPNGRAQRNFVRDIESSRVEHILIAGNGGTDAINNDPALDPLVEIIHYVVSSNADDLEAAGQSTSDGIVALMPSNTQNRQSEISTSVFAGNTVGGIQSSIFGTSDQVAVSLGNNLTDVDGTINGIPFFQATGDHIGSVDYVVTSVADRIDANDGGLSLREAVIAANANDNVAEEIWLPAWTFVLTRDRATFGTGTTDMDASFGDLDISDSLVVRGIQDQTSVAWRAGVTDAVFDLLGDFTGDGITSADDGDVDGSDYLTWSTQNGRGVGNPQLETFSADGNDDGMVNGDDLAVWQANFGNTLVLTDVG